MRYLALRRRADLLLAGLGADRSRTLVITGGLSEPTSMPQAPEPMEPTSEPCNNGVNPSVDLGSKTK
jgi:hypothetical protein